jgi:hypothetical protein
LHVLFGAPGEQPDHASRAIACALALDQYAETFRNQCDQKGIALGVTRIGVHAGPAIVGNFGGGRFFDYTAYGDTINVAARLEAANKQLGTRLCVSAALAGKVEDFKGRPVGDLVLRGKTEPLRALEPLRDEQFSSPTTSSYLDAFSKLEARVIEESQPELTDHTVEAGIGKVIPEFSGFRRATSSIVAEMSPAITSPCGPARSRAICAAAPVPVATSRTLWPAAIPAASSSTGMKACVTRANIWS